MGSADEISIEFGVSKRAANIYFAQLLKKQDRARAYERVRKMADEAKAALAGRRAPTMIAKWPSLPAANAKYLPDTCIVCGNKTLISLGHKVHCETCGFSGDQLQDGDKSSE